MSNAASVSSLAEAAIFFGIRVVAELAEVA